MSKNTKKVFFISDVHFGIRSNSFEWLEIQQEYFNNFLIPYLKENASKDSELIIAGDVFDNRQSIHLLVMNTANEIISKLAEILPVHIIAGNHDIFRKSSTTINSLIVLKYIPNVTIYTEPTIVDIGNKTFFMMPWRGSAEEELRCANENPSDYMVCHTDFAGIRFNRSVLVEHGNKVSDYKGFSRIFSGHIHYQQTSGNLVMLGCPYPLTRSDMGNPKCVWNLDLKTNKLDYVVNEYSPKFIKLRLADVLDQPFGIISDMVENNFVDMYLTQEMMLSNAFPVNMLLDELSNARKITIRVEDEIDNYDDLEVDSVSPDLNFNLMKFAKKYIEDLSYSDKTKDALFAKVEKLYELTKEAAD